MISLEITHFYADLRRPLVVNKNVYRYQLSYAHSTCSNAALIGKFWFASKSLLTRDVYHELVTLCRRGAQWHAYDKHGKMRKYMYTVMYEAYNRVNYVV